MSERARRMNLRTVRNRKAARERRESKYQRTAREIQMEWEAARMKSYAERGEIPR